MESGPKTLPRALAKARTCGRTSKKRAGLVDTALAGGARRAGAEDGHRAVGVCPCVCVWGATVLTASLKIS